MKRMRQSRLAWGLLGGLALMGGCSAETDVESLGGASEALTCDLGLVEALPSACTKANAAVSITASRLGSSTPAQVVADGAAYGVRLVSLGGTNEGALSFVPLQTTSYNIYLGTPNLPFRVYGPGGEVAPSCSSLVTSTECSKLRRVNSYPLNAGETYRLEVPATTLASYVRLYLQTRLEPVATCEPEELTRLDAACTDAASGSTPVTAALPNTAGAPSLSANTVYTVTLPTVGTNTYAGTFRFTPEASGDYELLLGTPKLPVAVAVGASPINAECSRLVPAAECSLLRRGDRLSLEAGTTYSFTLGPNVNTRFIRATLRRSVGPDECALNTDDCDDAPNACVNTDDGFTCVCPEGYVGTGVGVDGCSAATVDECALNTDDCDDAPEACVDTAEGFTCVCPPGFVGTGVGLDGCTFAAPDECALGLDNCDDDPDACVDTLEGFSCVCPGGFVGSGVGVDGCEPG